MICVGIWHAHVPRNGPYVLACIDEDNASVRAPVKELGISKQAVSQLID